MPKVFFSSCLIVLSSLFLNAQAPKKPIKLKQSEQPVEKTLDTTAYFNQLIWRNIGPMRGGRSVCATGINGQPQVYYFGSTGGGVWKTEDAGINWKNVSDGFFKTGSVGAISAAASDPNVLYVGMGEHAPRGVMTSYGDGVYKTTDAGRTWTNMGLELTRHISRIRIHPNNPELLYVAAQGALHGPSKERGVYRSADGGKNWEQVLFVDDNTGCADLEMDPTNPRILYAAMWDHRRLPWQVQSGGKGSGLYKSTDGGSTWKKIQKGLPDELGKIGISVCASNPDKVYALIESNTETGKGGLFVSKDAGANWERISTDHRLTQRAWYYIEVFADPLNEEVLYVLNSPAVKSIDGGRTWNYFQAPHGDYHQLWINPSNSKNMIVANDGGAAISFNGGQSWSTQDNQPTAQFYRVNADEVFPFNLYGGQQDNSSVKIASRTTSGYSIDTRDWSSTAGGESAFLAFDPKNPRMVMGGSYQGTIEALDMEIRESRPIMEHPVQYQALQPKDMKYRFNWNAPIIYSKHEPGVFYHAGNRVFKTSNLGKEWIPISPDLTTHDTSKMGVSGVPYTNEGAGGENYCTITYLKESPHEKGLLYSGSDDGMVYITRNGGEQWENISPAEVKGAQINAIEVSPHNKATAYLAVHRYKTNDFRPMIFKTTDYGKSWKQINTGIPYGAYVRVVREDDKVKDLLYAGTETGFYISYDGGLHWSQLQLNLPVTPITDLMLHQNHLLASTQGRAFWILDDLSPIREFKNAAAENLKLFSIEDAYRISGGSQLDGGNISEEMRRNTAGSNAANGVVIYYAIQHEKDSVKELTLEIQNAQGAIVRSFHAVKPANKTSNNGTDSDPLLTLNNGLNRFVWDMRYPTLASIPNVFIEGSYAGGKVAPGHFKVVLKSQGKQLESTFEILADPRIQATAAQFAEQENLQNKTAEDVNDIHVSVVRMRQLQQQLNSFTESLANRPEVDTILKKSKALLERIHQWEEILIQPKSQSNDDVINFVNKLSANIIFLRWELDTTIPNVTQGQRLRYDELHKEWLKSKAEFEAITTSEVNSFNALCKAKGLGFLNMKD